MSTTQERSQGGSWLLQETDPSHIFTPEKMTEEHRLIARTTDEFIDAEVLPNLERLEAKDWELARRLLRRCGELGLLGTNVPEQYGGLDLDKVSSLIVAEHIARSASFATTYGGQANLCVLPIFLFGTDAQKQQYLPKLVAGELVGAYALSETGSGSDAFAAKTGASRAADGTWILNGEKMWITNGGFADVYIVFAKVDGEQFSAFIVERTFPGVSHGKEEHKMGLHGSSTTPVLLQDARVPAENLLGEVGRGHKIAFNVLNYGRLKLASSCSGGAKFVIREAAKYATSRRQFGQPISSFGAIRHKLAEMTARAYGIESMLYRTAGLIDDMIARGGGTPAAALAALEEFAIEASLLKVASSEMLNYVLDENVQIHGGNGFVRDYRSHQQPTIIAWVQTKRRLPSFQFSWATCFQTFSINWKKARSNPPRRADRSILARTRYRRFLDTLATATAPARLRSPATSLSFARLAPAQRCRGRTQC
jgi:alkylation response protein AidB-like acyl-CoA dehydrogenase